MEKAKFYPVKGYIDFQKNATADIERFWAKEATKLEWFKPWEKVLEWEEPFAKWFVGGRLNASYLCVDRHLYSWHKNKVALYWE
ncbi:MAG: acetyl-coenzyme A synthetase N-terminal domain-containing protein, partial [Euryarchaeota archaeon]|nr:acetyl-coenzyme A synthetase N-terminal domain-containing protein [Euryarchaeota archaeon]